MRKRGHEHEERKRKETRIVIRTRGNENGVKTPMKRTLGYEYGETNVRK